MKYMDKENRLNKLEDTLKKIKISLNFMINSIKKNETPLTKDVIISCLEAILGFFYDVKI